MQRKFEILYLLRQHSSWSLMYKSIGWCWQRRSRIPLSRTTLQQLPFLRTVVGRRWSSWMKRPLAYPSRTRNLGCRLSKFRPPQSTWNQFQSLQLTFCIRPYFLKQVHQLKIRNTELWNFILRSMNSWIATHSIPLAYIIIFLPMEQQ